ncbi:uncharacterized protein BO66DRAFT_152692 [Aspergillus aculeatinus CBS 121060]|uniref:Uncharacterized protein n=1 Tax=Aspergillus aculeatinus CBS 121060 TaxID=1448322 RepID=A0ACD1H259_9EURO|nr:hypothetical protein BO66DRAFT_152692 [Aspergillus aculeatinus CBS 121060]RAH67506.1 hypothetical protein BO66DRAFT_152692 [Aspergillus aculeatinus CBS 121060]
MPLISGNIEGARPLLLILECCASGAKVYRRNPSQQLRPSCIPILVCKPSLIRIVLLIPGDTAANTLSREFGICTGKPKLVLLFLIPRGRLRWLGCYQIWLVCVTRRDQDQLLPGIGILGIFPLAAKTSFEVNASTNSKSRPITENTAEGARFGRGIHPIMPIHSIRSDARAVVYSLGVSAATIRAIGPTLIDAFEAFAQGNTNRKKSREGMMPAGSQPWDLLLRPSRTG